jgi:peptidoglycan-N-acetylmuramic acid deacetylase
MRIQKVGPKSESWLLPFAKYFRFPEGRFSESCIKHINSLGYKSVFWSFGYADWDNNNQMSEERAMAKILDNLHNGAIILLHPTSKTNANIMSALIEKIKAQGYRFGSLDEIV